jgi:hypothetical protein
VRYEDGLITFHFANVLPPQHHHTGSHEFLGCKPYLLPKNLVEKPNQIEHSLKKNFRSAQVTSLGFCALHIHLCCCANDFEMPQRGKGVTFISCPVNMLERVELFEVFWSCAFLTMQRTETQFTEARN